MSPRLFAASLAVLLAAAPAGRAEVRVITGPGLPVLPRAERPPERVTPPAKPLPPPAPIVTRRFAPILVEDAATLVAGGLRLVQPGVVPIAVEETCRDGAEVEWPCGRRALAALRAMVRLRPMECDVPKDAKRGRFETACRLGGVDFGEAAVRAGWARAVPGSAYEALAETARREGRGIFGPAPAAPTEAVGPEPASEALPADVTMAPLAGGRSEPLPPRRSNADPAAPNPTRTTQEKPGFWMPGYGTTAPHP